MKFHWVEGLGDYTQVLAYQDELVALHQVDPEREDEMIFVEHAPVYTMGRMRDQSSLRNPQNLPHRVVEINRGGQATYHGPGQLVGYPIMNLNKRGRDVHHYITSLEEILILACAEYGVLARRRPELTGVWVEDRKLASIGVGLKKWVTMHGFALNIEPSSLLGFQAITPCGIAGVQMTCLAHEMTSPSPSLQSFSQAVEASFARVFGGI